MEVLLKSPLGRDFTLITASGVTFAVHSVMLVGGPKVLEDGVFSGGGGQEHSFVNLPAHHHPTLIDRLVTFLYTCKYWFDPSGSSEELKRSNFRFYNATHIPEDDPSSPAIKALVGVNKPICKLHVHFFMYALAEDLTYPALQEFAYDCLSSLLIAVRGLSANAMSDVVKAIFAPLGSPGRVCQDKDGVLQRLVVASFIAHVVKDWKDEVMQQFTDTLQGPDYTSFWTAYHEANKQFDVLIQGTKVAKDLGQKRTKAANERNAAMQLTGRGPGYNSGGARTMSRNNNHGGGIRKARKDKASTKSASQIAGSDEDVDMEL
ncbi:hypothetical protein ACEQ8H_000197 [Pleosporales sp. CAS-2024a]